MLYTVFGFYLLAVNLLLFILMGWDKAAARRSARRTRETTLLGLAVIGGSVGGILGMLLFRHKTKKPAFRIGMPLILICQALLAGLLLRL